MSVRRVRLCVFGFRDDVELGKQILKMLHLTPKTLYHQRCVFKQKVPFTSLLYLRTNSVGKRKTGKAKIISKDYKILNTLLESPNIKLNCMQKAISFSVFFSVFPPPLLECQIIFTSARAHFVRLT